MAINACWGLLRRLGLAALMAMLACGAQALQAVPALTAHVVDRIGLLSAPQVAALEAKLVALEAAKGAQVVVLVVATTQPEDDASFANRVGNAWKIGRQGVGDGLLLLVVRDDRKVRIEVAKTLEGAVPDLLASRIIEQAITPRFKQGEYAGGIDAGLDRISAAIRGEPLPEVVASAGDLGAAGLDWTRAAFFLFVLVPVVGAVARGIFDRGLGALLTGCGAGILVFFLSASLWLAAMAGVLALLFALLSGLALPSGRGGGGFGGGGGSFGGGGGFGSGGGGNFGGGGASGRW
jgi:uncharacterized protein